MPLEFLNLKTVRQEQPAIYDNTIAWVATLTPELDYEDGPDLVKMIQNNLEIVSPFAFFILYDSSTKEVVGIAYVLPDDENVGRDNHLEGIWIGGINIKREHRGKGYGKIFFRHIDDYLSHLPIRNLLVSLFVHNPIALRIYEQFGFQPTDLKILYQQRENQVYSKVYNQNPPLETKRG